MKKLALTFIAILMIGCTTIGSKFDMNDVHAMKPGVTTYEEAVSKLGKPKGTIYNNDGSIAYTWVYIGSSGSRTARILFYKDRMVRVLYITE